MNAPQPLNLTLPALGSLIEGGYFHGVLLIDGKLYGEVTGPKAETFILGKPWHEEYQDVPGAVSDLDGLANTLAMAEAKSPLALAAVECRSGGYTDWYIAARVGLMLQHSAKKLLPEAEAFEERWHWSSTQYSRGDAWGQDFYDGDTGLDCKDWSGGAARFVRRFPLQSFAA